MTEINTSLRTMTFSNGQTAKLHQDTEAMRINDSKNALTLTLGNSDNAVQTKEFKNGKIYRFTQPRNTTILPLFLKTARVIFGFWTITV